MSDVWARLDLATFEWGTVTEIADEYGGDLETGDEGRKAVRLSTGSDGLVLYGTPAEFCVLAAKLERTAGA